MFDFRNHQLYDSASCVLLDSYFHLYNCTIHSKPKCYYRPVHSINSILTIQITARSVPFHNIFLHNISRQVIKAVFLPCTELQTIPLPPSAAKLGKRKKKTKQAFCLLPSCTYLWTIAYGQHNQSPSQQV